MKLAFEYTLNLGAGAEPQMVHMMDNQLKLITLKNGTVTSQSTNPALGLYNALTFQENGVISPDKEVSHTSLKKVAHYGAYGFWSNQLKHSFVMYMLPVDISKTLIQATLTFNKNNVVSQFSASFENIKGELLNRYRAYLSPNTKLEVFFTLGQEKEISLGQFYVDRTSCKYPKNQVSVTARNGIGKLLKEQYFDEQNTFTAATLQENLKQILVLASVEFYFVSDSIKTWKLSFEQDLSILEGLEQVIDLLPNWKIAENFEGTIGIGPASDLRFDQPSRYRFYRDKTCWSYQVEYDDSESVRRVCVRCKNPEQQVYATVEQNNWWVVPEKRTMYVDVADGTELEEIQSIASNLALSVARSGRMESFIGIFTPQLMLGDEVQLIENGRKEIIGTVTSIKHTLGRKGFYTEFTVDSGGRKGKPRLSEMITQVAGKSKSKAVTITK